MSLCSICFIFVTPSFHLLSLPPRNFVVIDNDNEDRKEGVDNNVFEDDVCDDCDCGFVFNDVCEGPDTNERDEKSVDDDCSDSELDSVDDKCVDNAGSCLAEQSDVDDGDDAVFDSESRDDDSTMPGSQLATVGMFASCVENDND